MPRHTAFIPLSHDHHHTLVLALRLKKGGPTTHKDLWPTDIHEQRRRTLACFHEEIFPHFELEESVIFPLARSHREAAQLINELLNEHDEVRAMISKLASPDLAPEDLPTLMALLGGLLETHIRKEERVLFVMLERSLSADEMDSIERAARSKSLR